MLSPIANRTPESQRTGLRRKDSKNALTTCHGVTSTGRACRRPLANAKAATGAADFAVRGAFVIPRKGGDPAVFFCWQHRDQAELLLRDDGDRLIDLDHEIEGGRRSLETVFEQLRLEEVDGVDESCDELGALSSSSPSPSSSPIGRSDLRNLKGAKDAFAPITCDQASERKYSPQRSNHSRQHGRSDTVREPQRSGQQRHPQLAKQREKHSFWSSMFSCFSGSEEPRQSPAQIRRAAHRDGRSTEYTKDPKLGHTSSNGHDRVSPHMPRPREGINEQYQKPRIADSTDMTGHKHDQMLTGTNAQCRSHNGQDVRYTRLRNCTTDSNRCEKAAGSQAGYTKPRPPPYQRGPNQVDSRSPDWHPKLPHNASDSTRLSYAKLLTAMSEPPTKHDNPGYIYIFWQTEEQQTGAEVDAAFSVISDAIAVKDIRTHETVLQRRFFQTSANARLPDISKHRQTIFLKVGRAANVHQRLNQWQKQCNYSISLLRFYPYNSSTSAAMQVPFVGKVEKVIHLQLEMLGRRVKKPCRCGTEHREWFEVPATVAGIREVDGIVRDWVRWSEGRFGREV